MPVIEEEMYVESEGSDNEEQYSQLYNSVSLLDNTQRVKAASRKEPSTEVSEYTLSDVKSKSDNVVNVKELAQVLGDASGQVSIVKKVKKVTQKSKTLPKPLEKPVEERLKRSAGYENLKKQLQRWDAVVTRNALKDTITFPLKDNSMKMQPSSDFLKQFKTATPLEMEIANVLQQNTNSQKDEEDEEDKRFPLTLEEMLEKRKEMALFRAKLSYKEAKAQRQSKIKSKKYHRLMKRQKIREQLKEFELLQKTDPEAALKKLAELDKTRAKERASLRHRNTGQWAKNLAVRAKYDVESRKVLAEQLKLSRELTQKISSANSSEDENEEVESSVVATNSISDKEKDNPWNLNISEEVNNFVTGYKKFWNEKNKEANSEKKDFSSDADKHTDQATTATSVEQNKIKKNNVSKSSEKKIKLDNSVEKHSAVFKGEENPKKLNKKKLSKNYEKKVKRNSALLKADVKPKKIKNKSASVNIHSSSGVWIVTPVEDDEKSKSKEKVQIDVDTLFDDLNNRLLTKSNKKLKTIKAKLKSKMKKFDKKKTKKVKKNEFDLSLKNSSVVERPDVDVELAEGGETEVSLPEKISFPTKMKETTSEIDPTNFIQVKPKVLRTWVPDNTDNVNDVLDDDEEQQLAIEEAFGDDDVVAEFQAAKEEEEKKRQVEISTTLPGWGDWGGTGIVPNPRKKRRLVVNLPPRKDYEKPDIIINENENPNIKTHLVKEVPHPFKSVDAFEANIRAPVGRDWVPETAHRKLIQKQVETKLGTIIEPMDEDEIIRHKKEMKSLYQGKKKKTNL